LCRHIREALKDYVPKIVHATHHCLVPDGARGAQAYDREPFASESPMAKHFQSDLETLKKRGIRGNLARRCAITLCWDHAGLSHDEIAALFRMPSSNSVAQTIRRTKAHDAQTLKGLKNQISHK
jgi:hypothetical protein